MPKRCKFYKQMRTKGYTRCLRDNSIRNGACPCPYYKKKLWYRFNEWLGDRLFEFDNWLWGVIHGRR